MTARAEGQFWGRERRAPAAVHGATALPLREPWREPLGGAPGGSSLDPTAERALIEQVVSALVVSQIVMANTLHAQGVMDKRHLAHAFARAIDVLQPANADQPLLLSILDLVKNAHMQMTAGAQPDVRAWLQEVMAQGGTLHG